jgi:hypothetical protein
MSLSIKEEKPTKFVVSVLKRIENRTTFEQGLVWGQSWHKSKMTEQAQYFKCAKRLSYTPFNQGFELERGFDAF